MDEELRYLTEHGIIDLPHIRQQMEMAERKEILESHPYKVWEGKGGKWFTYVDKGKDNPKKLVRRNSQKAVEDAIVKAWRDYVNTYTIEMAFEAWMERKAEISCIEKSTQRRYRNTFDRYYDEWRDKNLRFINPDDYVDFLERLVPKYHMTAKEFSNVKTITRGFLKLAKRNKIITWYADYMIGEVDVSRRTYRHDYKEDYEEVYNEAETAKVIDYLSQNMDSRNMALLLIFMTGMRVGEVVSLKNTDVCDGYITVRRTEQHIDDGLGNYSYVVKESPKTEAGRRDVVIPPAADGLIHRIRMLNPFGEWLFVEDRNCSAKGNRLNEKQIEYRLYKVCQKVGIYHKSPHKIRKTYISMLLDGNLDNRLITDQVGHTNVGTSERYYHRNRKSIERKRMILSEIPELGILGERVKKVKSKVGY